MDSQIVNIQDVKFDTPQSGGGGIIPASQVKFDSGDPIMSAAQRVSERTGANPELVYGQWYHETGGFTNRGARQLNNLAGITNGGVKNGYKSFPSLDDFVDYYSGLLMNRYPEAIAAATPDDFSKALKKGGYYTDKPKTYASGVKSGARKYVSPVTQGPDLSGEPEYDPNDISGLSSEIYASMGRGIGAGTVAPKQAVTPKPKASAWVEDSNAFDTGIDFTGTADPSKTLHSFMAEEVPTPKTAGEFAANVPKSLVKNVVGAVEFIPQAANQVSEGFSKALDTATRSRGTLGEAWQQFMDPVAEISEGVRQFVGKPLGLYGAEEAKESWLKDPVGSALAVAPIAKAGMKYSPRVRERIREAIGEVVAKRQAEAAQGIVPAETVTFDEAPKGKEIAPDGIQEKVQAETPIESVVPVQNEINIRTGQESSAPKQGWRSPVTEGMGSLVELQSQGLPRGRFFALDKPFESFAHNSSKAKIESIPDIKNIYDPDGVIGTPTPSVGDEMISLINEAKPSDYRQAMTDFLKSKGYDAYVRGIDGDKANRELIVFDNTNIKSQPENTLASLTTPNNKIESVPSPIVESGELVPFKPKNNITRSAMVKEIEKALEIPIRQGRDRLLSRNAAGIFKIREEAIRLKRPNDVETAAHEAGHYLQKVLDYPDKAMPPEVMDLAYTEAHGTKTHAKEGFAEFVRLYITQPDQASKKAPAFFSDFEKKLQEFPEINDSVIRVRQAWQEWLATPDIEKMMSVIQKGSDTKKPRPTMNDIYRAVVDELEPLKTAKRIVEQKKGGKLRPSEDFYTLAWLTRGWARKAEQYLKHGTFQHEEAAGVKFTGKSFEEIVKPIEKEGMLPILDAYLLGKRAVNDPRLIEKYRHQLPEQVLRNGTAEIEANYPKVKEAAEALYQYNDQLLDYLEESGRIAPDLKQAIRQKNLFYAPLYRVIDQTAGPQGLSKGKFDNVFNPIKRLSEKPAGDVYSPVENIIYNTYAIINAAERNRIGKAIIKAEKTVPGLGGLVEKLPPRMKATTVSKEEMAKYFDRLAKKAGIDEGSIDADIMDSLTSFRPDYSSRPNEVVFYDNGKPHVYELRPDFYEAVTKLNVDTLSTAVKIAAIPAKMLRAGATLSPEFIARNPFRDQISAGIYSHYGFVPFVDMARGIFHMLKQDELWQRYNVSGAAHAALVSLDRNYLSKNLKELMASRKISTYVKNPIEALRALSELTEEGTRVGAFLKAQKKEGQSLDALLKSGVEGRDITIDFSRIGAKTKSINAITAFWNAQVQGIDKMYRELISNESGKRNTALVKIAAGITVPSILLYLAQKDDPAYQEIPTWRRIMFWNIVTHKEDGTAKHIWSIPKPFELGLLFGSLPEMTLDYMNNKDPKAMEEMATSLWNGLTPGLFPTGLIPIMELKGNKSYFFDRPIVPRDKEDLKPVLQYGPQTSESVRLLAEAMNKVPYLDRIASPAKIQHLIFGYTAGLGRLTTEGLDRIVRELDLVDVKPDQSMKLEDLPGLRAFMQRFPSANTRSIEQFYDRYTKAKTDWESKKEVAGVRGMGLKLNKPDDLENYEKVAKVLSAQRKVVGLIWKSRTMTPEQKRELMDKTYLNMTNIARATLGKKGDLK